MRKEEEKRTETRNKKREQTREKERIKKGERRISKEERKKEGKKERKFLQLNTAFVKIHQIEKPNLFKIKIWSTKERK